MFKRYWIIAITLGLALSSTGYAQDETASENHPSTEDAAAEGQQQSEQQQSPAIDPTPALEGIERAIRDLEAEIDHVEQERQRENSSLHSSPFGLS